MAQEKNSVLRRDSRFVSGGETETGESGLEWWERTVFTTDSTDISYTVELKFAGRLDQIAALFLGEPRNWWVIAQYNNILDPYSEVIEGLVLKIPSADRVKLMLNGKTGGIASTREVPISILPIV